MAERFDLESRLREQAQRDPAFRERLLEDPQAAVSEALGVDVDQVTIRVVEEQPGEVVIVVPPGTQRDAQLTDAELASAAGGGWSSHCDTTSGTTCQGQGGASCSNTCA